jgi:hypothetical protein
MSNNKPSSVNQLIEMIDWEISMLEMDAGNHVEWSMSIMFGTLKKIKEKAEQAKVIHKEQTLLFLEEYDEYVFRGGSATAEQYYNETFECK